MSLEIEARNRAWIFEALMVLLEKKTCDKISMENIAKKAGISRQTIYRLFKDKYDIVSQFLTTTAAGGLLSIERESKKEKPDTILIQFNMEFVGKHYGTLKKMLADVHIHQLITHLTEEKIFDIMEYYKAMLPSEEYVVCEYKLVYQITGCFAVLTNWFNKAMPQPMDELVVMLNAMARPEEKTWGHLPNIEIRSW